MALGSLVIELQANVARLQSDMQQVQSIVDARMQRVNEAANEASKHVENVGKAGKTIGRVKGVDEMVDQLDHLNFKTTAARRELLVLAHEASQGNWSKFGGSLMVLGERIDAMSLIFSKAGLAILGVGAVLAGLTVMAVKAYQEHERLTKALKLTGDAAGFTAGHIKTMALNLDEGEGHARQAQEVLTALAETGRFTGQTFESVGNAALQFARKTGASIDDTLKEFMKLDDGAAKWAVEMNKRYHFLTLEQYKYIHQLEEQGEKEKAQQVAADALAAKMSGLSEKISVAAYVWRKLGEAAGWAWGQMDQAVNGKSIEVKIQDQLTKLAEMEQRLRIAKGYGRDTTKLQEAYDAEYKKLKELSSQKDADDKTAAAKGAAQKREEGRIAAQEWYDGFRKEFASQKQKRDKEIEQYTQRANLLGIDPAQRAKDIALINEKYKDHGTAGIDKANLDAQLRPIEDAIKREDDLLKQRESILQKYYHADQISSADYYQGQRNALEAHIANVRAQYEKEIAITQQFAKTSGDARQRIEASTKAKELEDKMNRAIAESLAKLNELTPQQAKDTEAYRQEVEKLNDELAKLQGKLGENAAGTFDRAHAKLTQQAFLQNDTGTQAKLDQARRLSVAQGDLNEAQREAQIILDRLSVTQNGYDLAVRSGQMNELDGLLKTGEARRDAAQRLGEISARITEIAMQSGDPKMLSFAQQFDQQVKQVEASADTLKEKFGDLFANSLSTEIQAVVNHTKSLKDAVLDFANSIEKAITQFAANALAKQLFSSGGGAGGGDTGFFGSIVGMIAKAFGGGMADGGDVRPGQFYEVAEHGPELLSVANRTFLMTGNQSGTVIPMQAGGGGGRQAVFNMSINVPPGTSRQSAQQQAAAIMRQAQIAQARNT